MISQASKLFLKTVSSLFSFPTKFPVLTSIAISASVFSIIKNPPDGSFTVLFKEFFIKL